jgi:hypothetical protein
MAAGEIGQLVRGLAPLVTSALHQLRESEAYKPAFPRYGGILVTRGLDSARYFRMIEPAERAWNGGRDG